MRASRFASSTGSGVDQEVAACIAQVIKRIEFPKAVGGGTVQVNYPFQLKPSETTVRQQAIKELLQ